MNIELTGHGAGIEIVCQWEDKDGEDDVIKVMAAALADENSDRV